ncbi:pteridine reductase [Azospirillaceae bacterium]
MDDLHPKTVLITGAARRIGCALALDLASHGWSVAVHHNHSTEDAQEVVRLIHAQGGKAVALQADLSRETETTALIPRAIEALGPMTALINNASVFKDDSVASMTRDSWDEHIETNLRAPFVLIQSFSTQLSSKQSGCVINVLDQRVWNLTPRFLSYTVSKSALWTLTRTLAMALAPRIRVNAIGPGPTLRNERQTEEHFQSQCRNTPLQRQISLKDICDAARYLLSAQTVTGQMIALDGGEHLGWAQPGSGLPPSE